jgi:hypothetical protein
MQLHHPGERRTRELFRCFLLDLATAASARIESYRTYHVLRVSNAQPATQADSILAGRKNDSVGQHLSEGL